MKQLKFKNLEEIQNEIRRVGFELSLHYTDELNRYYNYLLDAEYEKIMQRITLVLIYGEGHSTPRKTGHLKLI